MKAEANLEVYRRFQGSLREHPLRFFPIWTTGLRTALKQRKALILLYAPALIATVIFSFLVYMGMMAKQLQEEQSIDLQDVQSVTEALAKQAAIQVASPALQMLDVVRQILEFAEGGAP